MDELRNISCTSFFSKVLELYVLRHARKTIKMGPSQYGGKPGVSTTHMLVDVWTRITEDLEDNRAVSIISAVDYSKVGTPALSRSYAPKGSRFRAPRIAGKLPAREDHDGPGGRGQIEAHTRKRQSTIRLRAWVISF